MTVLEMGKVAKAASRVLAISSEDTRNNALNKIADRLIAHINDILEANKIDCDNGIANGLSNSLIDRLMLTEERIQSMANAVREVATLPAVIGEIMDTHERPNGLKISKVRVPIGVIGIIFEARPNVTSDAAALTLKSGNAVILRGGKEAINSNIAIINAIREGLAEAGLPEDCVSLIKDTSRQSSVDLMTLNGYLDLLIPRGGAGLIRAVVENSTVPVIETGVGNCHVFVDESANIDMATDIIFNAKTSRPSVCNAIETVLVDSKIAEDALPVIAKKLAEKNVEIRGCERTCEIIKSATPATEEDYFTEFLDYILAIKVVDGVDAAIEHIAKYSSGHSECIVTQSDVNANKFTASVDAAAVYVNASTRFTDGGEFGLGAEIGISTQKIHARGPMGIKELTAYKYVIKGNGQIR